MINIYVATKVRGGFVNLFNSSIEGVEFIWNKGKTYEINSKLKLRVAKIVKSKLGNYLGSNTKSKC